MTACKLCKQAGVLDCKDVCLPCRENQYALGNAVKQARLLVMQDGLPGDCAMGATMDTPTLTTAAMVRQLRLLRELGSV